MKFWKYHGLGNDFALIDGLHGRADVDPGFAERQCRRNTGIGADGILYLLPGRDGADVSMRILNADGSEAEMCGNGIRCLAKHAYDTGAVRGKSFRVWTRAGIKAVDCAVGPDGRVESVEVGMGKPLFGTSGSLGHEGYSEETVEVLGRKVRGYNVSMGNPHFVTFQKLDDGAKDELGPAIEKHGAFPNRTNVEFAVPSGGGIDVRVFERGAGWTMACGTGACATAVAGVLAGHVAAGEPIPVNLPGGTLTITVGKDFDEVAMDGPAELVYEARLLNE
ncbi:MAG: diaminopimelate epimerase [Thermoplasmatales archaeon]|nr:diaminopimelate epimerase [Thermoplasmatales archaeon]